MCMYGFWFQVAATKNYGHEKVEDVKSYRYSF